MNKILLSLFLILSTFVAFSQERPSGGSSSGAVTNGQLNIKSIYDFGALGGTNNDTVALQKAALSGLVVTFPPTNFTATDTISFSNPVTWIGINTFLQWSPSVTNAPALLIPTNAAGVSLQGFTIDGGDYIISSRTNRSRAGLLVNAFSPQTAIFDVHFRGFDTGVCLYATQNSGNSMNIPKILFTGNEMASNNVGITVLADATYQPEYLTLCNNNIFECNLGFYLKTSNILFNNDVISTCTTGGIFDGGGGNGIHMAFQNNIVNHCTTVLLINSCQDKLLISGNTFAADGGIQINNSKYVDITGNYFDQGAGVVSGNTTTNGPNYVIDNHYVGQWSVNFLTYDYSTGGNAMTKTNQLIHRGNYSLNYSGDGDGTYVLPAGGSTYFFPIATNGTSLNWLAQ